MMRSLSTFFLLCCLLCLAQTEFPFAFQDSGNGVPVGWHLSKSSGNSAVKDGVVSLEGQSTGDLYLFSGPVGLAQDVTYTLTCQARCIPGGDYMIYYEYWVDDKYESHIWHASGTGVWQDVKVTFAKRVSETPSERVLLRLMNDSKLEVRNLKIVEENHNHGVTDSFPPAAPTTRFIHNGSFEWYEKYWDILADARVVRSDDNLGNTALRLGRHGFVVQQSIHLLPHRKYRLTWYARPEQTTAGTLQLALRYMPRKEVFHDQEYPLTAGPYVRHELEFTTADEPDPVIDLILKNAGQEPLLLAQFYLREFSDEETAPLRIQLDEPHYRDAIYATMPCRTVQGQVLFNGDFETAQVRFNGQTQTVTPSNPHFQFPAETLADGDHPLVVLADTNGATKEVSRKVIHRYPHCHGEITIGRDKNFYCDGHRFFPFFMGYNYEDPEKPVMSYLVATRGLTGYSASSHDSAVRTLRELDRAQHFGLKVMLSLGEFSQNEDYEAVLRNTLKHILTPEVISHPALFGYNFCDEPWAREVPAYKFEAAERIFRELDPYHPVFINESPRGVVPEYLADYAKHSDLYGVDIYPLPAAIRHSAIADKSMASVGKYAKIYNQAAGNKPVLMWLQGYQWHKDGPLAVIPNAHELKFMLLDALLHGAKAIMIYNDDMFRQEYYRDFFGVSELATAYEAILATGREIPEPLQAEGLLVRSFETPDGDRFDLLLNETEHDLILDIAALTDSLPIFSADSTLEGTTLTLHPWGFASFSRRGTPPSIKPLLPLVPEYEALKEHFLEIFLDEKFPKRLSQAEWIWFPGDVANTPEVSLERELKFTKPVKSVVLSTTADNVLKLYLDDKLILDSPDWQRIHELDVTSLLRPRGSLLRMEAKNLGGPAGLMLLVTVTYDDGTQETIGTDSTWDISNGEVTTKARSFGKVGYARTWNWMYFDLIQTRPR